MLRLVILGMVCMTGVGLVGFDLSAKVGSDSQPTDQRFYQSCDPRYNAC